MKFFLRILIVSFVIGFANYCVAGQFAFPSSYVYGEIVHIRSYGNAATPNMPTYIQVAGAAPSESNECPHANFGAGDLNYWVIAPEEKHILSIALMAYTTKTKVKITTNDTVKKSGVCPVVYIDLES
jgi:hypothetical protein